MPVIRWNWCATASRSCAPCRARLAAEPTDDEAVARAPEPAALDTIISAWKVEGRAPPETAAPLVAAFAATLVERGQIDFDDLLVGALDAMDHDPELRQRWQGRFRHVLVDEFQDVDAAQLRFVRVLAEPERNLFVVGDDDQTIYAWRLADVRRILGFADMYPGAHRVQLATNYRCPRSVIEAAAQLIGVNESDSISESRHPHRAMPTRTRSRHSRCSARAGPMRW